jgi:hypothetical protein
MYLTHEDFTAMGGSIDAALFPRLEAKARAFINSVTHGRVADDTPVRDAVRNCMFELIVCMHADESTVGMTGREIASMSNDGVSVSFATDNARSIGYNAIARCWLLNETTAAGVPLMYAGVDA